jgi:hypothetical protein
MQGAGALLYSSRNFVALVAYAGGLACAYHALRQRSDALPALTA